MQPETIAQLRQISTPKAFMANDYVCYEGQPGEEMYIILKGSVGVFITSAIGTLTQVATITAGSFFGEMAIFDSLPRSASCIALENTVTVAVTKDNLHKFLATCPEIAMQMLENMSGRIRTLNDELYKNNRFVKNRHVPKFVVPTEYNSGHVVKNPYTDPVLVNQYKQACPICGKAVTVVGLKRNILEEKSFGLDCRITYACCDPLWTEVISCPHCYYTNHYLKFFDINNFEFELIKDIVNREHKPVLESRLEKRSDFDFLVIKYLQAININEHINAGSNALIGGLWRNLYWLSKDVDDNEFAKYAAKKAVAKYKTAIDENQITDLFGKTSTAMSLAALLTALGDYKEVAHYCEIAMESSDERIKNNATRLREKMQNRK